jgi:hypothetical protein
MFDFDTCASTRDRAASTATPSGAVGVASEGRAAFVRIANIFGVVSTETPVRYIALSVLTKKRIVLLIYNLKFIVAHGIGCQF